MGNWRPLCLFGISCCCLLCLSLLGLLSVNLRSEYRDSALVAGTLVEIYDSISQCIERVILTLSYILTGEVLVATLTNDNVAGYNLLATPDLYA